MTIDRSRYLELEIKQIIVDKLDLKVSPAEIADNDPLFGGSLGFDSLATLEIIFTIEEQFGIKVEDEELSADLFADVQTLANYVRKKLTQDPCLSHVEN